MNKTKKSVILLVIAFILIFAGSLSANRFNTSGGSVDVERIYFETPRGVLSGLLYKPEGADEEPVRRL